jgi:DNA-binding XRE family transcriptional regulator
VLNTLTDHYVKITGGFQNFPPLNVMFYLTPVLLHVRLDFMNTKLKKFIRQQNISIKELAKKLNVSRQYLTAIANGTPAGKGLAKSIVIWSKNEVTYTDLFFPSDE